MSQGVATVGTCMSFSAAIPATEPFDQAQYEALTWSQSGEATQIGDVGPENSVITFATICDGKVNKRMGPTNFGQQSLTIAWDSANAAQGILDTKARDKTPVAVRETLSTGDVLYYVAYVAMFKNQTGSATDFVRAAVTLEVDSEIVQVNA